jgi:hypothetical protein
MTQFRIHRMLVWRTSFVSDTVVFVFIQYVLVALWEENFEGSSIV